MSKKLIARFRRLRSLPVARRRRAVERAICAQPELARRAVLVEQGLTISTDATDGGRAPMIFGTDTGLRRVTCLVDIEEPGSLPPVSFDVILLAQSLYRAGYRAVIANTFDALRSGGVVIAAAPGRAVEELGRTFEGVTSRGFGPWRVHEVHKRPG